MDVEDHLEMAEELMAEAGANLRYNNNEFKVEKAHAQAVLAQAHIDMARLKANG